MCLVVALSAVGAPIAAAADAAAPEVFTANSVLWRGNATLLEADRLTPNSTYSLSADYGYFGDAGDTEATVTTSSSGGFHIGYTMTGDVPYAVSTVDIRVTGPDGTHTTSVGVAAPYLYAPHLCPGQPAQLAGEGFADGNYGLIGAFATSAPVEVTSSDGSLSTDAALARHLDDDVPVTVTARDAANTTFDFTLPVHRPEVERVERSLTDSVSHRTANCFEPGETLTFRSRSGGTTTPARLVVPASGAVSFDVDFVAGPDPSYRGGGVLTGSRSGRSVGIYRSHVWGTTLREGVDMSGNHAVLVSRRFGYEAPSASGGCTLAVYQRVHGGFSETWESPNHRPGANCDLKIGPSGDLVIRRGDGLPVWSTDTWGTGSGNYLVMGEHGRLVLNDKARHPVWDSTLGVIRSPRELGARQTLTRGQFLTNGSSRFGLTRTGNVVLSRSGHVLWTSGTSHSGATALTFSRGGDLYLTTARGKTVWHVDTSSGSTVTHLVLSRNGTVRIFDDYQDVYWHR